MTDPSASTPLPSDATPVSRLALRDGAIVLVALSLWAAADAWHAQTGLFLASLLGVVDGIAAGAVIGLLAHEWGHLAGARWAGGIAPTAKLTSFFPIFHFDMERSDPRAFRAMGVAGNVAHWTAVLLLALLLPIDSAPRAAIVCAAFGFALGASLTEFPVIGRAYSGASPIESFAGLTGDKLRRDRWIGIAAGGALFLVLAS